MSENIYVGSGKTKEVTGRWKDYFSASYSITINPEKLQEHIKEFNWNKFVKINMVVKNEPDQYWKDVSLTIDTFEPEQREETKTETETKTPEVDTSSLPF